MNISELTETYNTNEGKINKKKASIERLQKQLEKMQNKNSWVDVILRPIAQEISNIIGLPVWDVLGPFGLDCETSIHFAKDEESHKDVSKIKSITFVPNHGETSITLTVKDYTVDTGKGHTNNMHHPNVDITNLSIKELTEKWVA